MEVYQINPTKERINPDKINQIITDMTSNPHLLSKGHLIINELEHSQGFYLSLLQIVFNPMTSPSKLKLSSSILLNYLRKNWSDENFIEINEKMEIFQFLYQQHVLLHNDYFLRNLASKLIGLISAKEWPFSYDAIIKKILKSLQDSVSTYENECFLNILSSILSECDDRISSMTSEMLPIIISTFQKSSKSQKNREKCLIIITKLLNKLSFADGTDPELVNNSMNSNNCIEQCLSLFISIILSNPKCLFDIKKYAIRTLDILVRDMPIYSSSFFSDLIEPAWRVLAAEMTLFNEKVVFNNEIAFSESEIMYMNEEGYNYNRGYESDEEDEIYGIEGLIHELIDLAIDLLRRQGVVEAVEDHILTLFLCLKGYCLMPNNSILLWKNDPNMYITEEYDDENINTIRMKSVSLIRDISKEVNENILLKFLQVVISEFSQGLNPENYLEVIKLDDYNFLFPYFEKMNTHQEYIERRHEANLLILGSLSDDILFLKDKKLISTHEISSLIGFLFDVISNKSAKSEKSILVGRAIWCISRLLSVIRDIPELVNKIFDGISLCLLDCNLKYDISIALIAIQCLSSISDKLQKGYFVKNLKEIFVKMIEIIRFTTEDTLVLVIEGILSLSKIDVSVAYIVPSLSASLIINIYSENFNHPLLGSRLLQLIKLWCEDERSSNLMVQLFIPLSITVFEDFYKSLKNVNMKAFDDVKKTVITEHGHGNVEVKGSLDMLPNLIDIISILLKYCVQSNNQESLQWISLIISVICDILLNTNDYQIIQHGTSLLRFYVYLCKELIVSKSQQPLLSKVIEHVLNNTEPLESSLLYMGNLISQYFSCISKKIETSILESIVRRTYRLKMPSVVQSMVIVYARLFIHYPEDIFSFLMSFTIENRVGLKVLIDKWLLHQPLFRGKYFKNISIKALTVLLSKKIPIIESLMVIGYDPSHSYASYEVNAPLKILSVLIRCLNREILQEKSNFHERKINNDINQSEAKAKNEDDNVINVNIDEFQKLKDEEEDQIKEINSKLEFINHGKTGGLKNIEAGSEIYLSEMLVFDVNDIEGEEDKNVEEDLYMISDINVNFSLKDYLTEFLENFMRENGEYMNECLKVLPKKDQEMYKNFNLRK